MIINQPTYYLIKPLKMINITPLKFLLIMTTMLSCSFLFGQWYGEAGLNTSDFDTYKNANGQNPINFDYSNPQKLSLGLGYRFTLLKNKRNNDAKILQLGLGGAYDQHEINAVNRIRNLSYNYEYSYLSLESNLFLKLLSKKRVSLWAYGGLKASWLNYGAQTITSPITNMYIDLTNQGSNDQLNYFQYGAQLNVDLNTYTQLYFSYKLQNSFDINENQGEGSEEFKIKNSILGVGVMLSFKGRKKALENKYSDFLTSSDLNKHLEKMDPSSSEREIEILKASVVKLEDKILTLKDHSHPQKTLYYEPRKVVLLFDKNKAELTAASISVLKEAVVEIKKLKDQSLLIVGYADNQSGSMEYNQSLSERRTESIETFLKKEGITSTSRITAIGKGATNRFDEKDPKFNRRVEIIYTKTIN